MSKSWMLWRGTHLRAWAYFDLNHWAFPLAVLFPSGKYASVRIGPVSFVFDWGR